MLRITQISRTQHLWGQGFGGEPSSQLTISQVFICYDMTNYATWIDRSFFTANFQFSTWENVYSYSFDKECV